MRLPRITPLLSGYLVSMVAALALISPATTYLDIEREHFFDAMTQWVPAPQAAQLLVVDIDRRSYDERPDKTWSRSETAELISKISQGGATAIATDIVFSANCDREDERNNALKAAIASAPVVLGFLIADHSSGKPRPVRPVAVQRPAAIPDLWFAENAETSCADFQAGAQSAAAAFLVGDNDAHIRRVQAYTILDGEAYPALGLEAARLVAGGITPVIGGNPLWLEFRDFFVPLDDDGSFRFSTSSATTIFKRTISAEDVLSGKFSSNSFEDKVVFVGSSVPQLGGLRATASMPLEPSVQIHADIANALITGFIPHRGRMTRLIEALSVLMGGLFLARVTTRVRPAISAGLAAAAVVGTGGTAIVIYARSALLVDVVGISLSLIAVYAATVMLQFAWVRRAEARARSRFSQYLPHSVVERYIDYPGDERMGEERPVTAVFTDIEDFSALANKLAPRDLVTLLDVYFGEVSALITAYGGMVDKVVGDAVHAIFNALEEQSDHVDKALECAEAIVALTAEIRTRPGFAECQFGRTRIGVETGIAVVGEVGTGDKLDYTAYGNAINLAARLQEANKFLGTSICVGPEAAAQCDQLLLSLGKHDIRGFGNIELFTIQKRVPSFFVG